MSNDDESTAVATRGLRMRYGATDVLRGIDITVRRGEVFALLGPNGAGKTTTVEILEGYRSRSAGEVTVLGQDPARADNDWRQRIGIVLQSWRDHAQWRVGELVSHVAGYYRRPRHPADVLAQVGLTECRDQTVALLSGGQRSRLDVALAVVGSPDLLFLDEPTTGFDPEARQQFHELVRSLAHQEGVTVLLTTHDLAEAETLASRIAILVRGEIVADGTAAELAASVRAASEVRWLENGTRMREFTTDSSEFVWRLHQRFSGPVPELEVRKPSLEETYLNILRKDDDTCPPTLLPAPAGVAD